MGTGASGPEPAADLESVDARQHEVEDHEVGRGDQGPVERHSPVAHRLHGIAVALEVADDDLRHGDIVVDHQDPGRLHHRLEVRAAAGGKPLRPAKQGRWAAGLTIREHRELWPDDPPSGRTLVPWGLVVVALEPLDPACAPVPSDRGRPGWGPPRWSPRWAAALASSADLAGSPPTGQPRRLVGRGDGRRVGRPAGFKSPVSPIPVMLGPSTGRPKQLVTYQS